LSRTHRDLTDGPVRDHLVRLSWPMLIGIVTIMAFNLVDTWFVSLLGTRELAAMSFTFPVVTFVFAIALGIGIGASSVISRAIGRGERDDVRRLTTDALLLALIVVACFATVGYLTIDPLFRALGADEQTLPLIHDYMEIWYFGMVVLVVPVIGNSAIRATGDTLTPAVVMVIAGLANAIIDPLLIFGIGPFPRLEVAGAALATVIGRTLTLVVAVYVLAKREKMIAWTLPKLDATARNFGRLLAVGIPASATNLVVPVTIGVVTRMLAELGPEGVAAFGAGSRIEAFALMPLMAVSSGLGPFVGQNFGAKKISRLRHAYREGAVFSLLWCAAAAVCLALGARFIGGFFTDDEKVLAILVSFLLVVPFAHGFQGLFMMAGSLFNASGRPLVAFALAFLRAPVLIVPAAWLGGEHFGAVGIFGGIAAANLVVGSVSFLQVRSFTAESSGVPEELGAREPESA
jgi:putative MATE family efflux protein